MICSQASLACRLMIVAQLLNTSHVFRSLASVEVLEFVLLSSKFVSYEFI